MAGTEAVARDVRLREGTLRVRERGEGPPLMFLHGIVADGRLWDGVVDRLASRFRCVVPDLPLGAHRLPMPAGADLTPTGVARLVCDLIAELGLDDVTLVANDTGGAIAQVAVTDRGDRVGRLVLTNCDSFEHFPPPLFRYLKWLSGFRGTPWLLGQSLRLGPVRRLPIAYGWLAKKPVDPDLLSSWAQPLAREAGIRRDFGKVIAGMRPEFTQAAGVRLAEFERPVLLAWAPEDRVFPLDHAERLALAFPDARVQVVHDARTFLPLDQPERLAELVEEFVDDRAGATGRR